ncbi:MAG: hypothetical protein CR986_07040 [Ignavibacteriae bacterium]|nr:MAG: hypothetical protein CR986_07040 [Ignavibacteriota bacterium]
MDLGEYIVYRDIVSNSSDNIWLGSLDPGLWHYNGTNYGIGHYNGKDYKTIYKTDYSLYAMGVFENEVFVTALDEVTNKYIIIHGILPK